MLIGFVIDLKASGTSLSLFVLFHPKDLVLSVVNSDQFLVKLETVVL